MYKAIIFDIDGTLVDSSAGIIISIQYTIDKLGLKKLSNRQLIEFVGFSPLQKAFSYFCNIDDAMAQISAMTYREYYLKNGIRYAKIYDGIDKLVKKLSKKYKLAIATYKRLDTAHSLLSGLGLDKYFDFIFGADKDNKLSKKDIMELALQSCKCSANECVMIGDSCHDGQAANELGIDFIGVTYGFGFKNNGDVLQYNPVFIAQNVNDIIEFFKLNSKLIQK